MREVEVIRLEQLWAKPKDLEKLFSLGHTHVYDLIGQMKKHPKWRGSIVAYDHVTRVNIADFEKFWRGKSVVKPIRT